MRKLLMASAAVLGASSSLALAQPIANPAQGQLAAPYGAGPAANNNNNAWGTANTPSGGAAAGPLSTIYAPNVDKVPAPGTIVIRLNGRVEVDVTANYTSVDKGVTGTGAPTGFKLNPVGISSYVRLYPGFDGLAANGLRYGAAVELRENVSGGTANGSTFANGTSVGANGLVPSGTATGPSTNSSNETVFVRRAFSYLASDRAGIVRIGQTDGVIGLFDNCIFTSQCWDAGTGNFNGGEPLQGIGPGGPSVPFVWLAQAGAEYGNSKVVYLSPQFFGFDFGVQYAPNEGNSFQNTGNGVGCNQASASCINVSSGNDPTRWLNQVGAGLRFQQTFGPVDFKAYGFYETAGKENLTTSPYATTTQARLGTVVGGVAAGAQTLRYNNLGFYKAGVAVTAANFTLAGDYIGGKVNGQLAEQPTGGANENAILGGLTYANGPITLGVEYGVVESQGDARLTGISQRHEYEFGGGGAYRLAPGIQLVAEYQYEYRHQGGFDFATGTLGAGGTATAVGRTNDAKAQGFLFSTVLTW
ncbi:porin [Rhodopila sp.]|uniref:porin n=1 Tax=Rhodopila sp. TaxID=2480087 RepID=UPI003D0B6B80